MNHLLLTLMLPLAAGANPPALPPPPPGPPLSPLLYVRVLGPAGMKVTFHPGSPRAKTYEVPVDVGVRPGYLYRLELSGLPQLGGRKLYPTLEVRGMLQLPIDQAARHPVPVIFSEEEIFRAIDKGSIWTKVHYLEDPAQAVPIPSLPNEPPVTDVLPEHDPLHEARQKGRPMIVARLGDKDPNPAELARLAVPNTILFPGEQRLTLPPVPPPLPWLYWPVNDPLAGPRIGKEECLPDGGDTGNRVGIGPNGKLGGLDPSDTAMEYTSVTGRRYVAVSNRICICVPRYAVLRSESIPLNMTADLRVKGSNGAKAPNAVKLELPPINALKVQNLEGMVGREKTSSVHGMLQLHGYEQIKGVQIVGTINGAKVVGVVKEPDEIDATPFCQPISLFKWADPKEAQIGDVVTFFLRYHNHTHEPVDNLVISDSLTPRLEYIPSSSRADREASMTVEPNEAGSVIVRWQISGKLLPGQSGVVSFQARIR
ncbi:MAG TPA: hypothetical protein VGZ47_23600 [Gemmataceae bacterium]|jgi:uncharacterized repeat protein (TIGR01451 family)|nr:hypothetical protein [Gemmataceae bacterium]